MKKLLIPIFLMLVLVGLVTALSIDPIADKTVNENETLAITLTTDYTGNDTLVFDITPTLGTITNLDNATGLFNWTPDFTEAGTYDVVFSVTDGIDTDTENITITVNDVNRAPTVTGASYTMDGWEETITKTITASDPDTDNTLTYSIKTENASQADCSIVNTNQLQVARVASWRGTAHCTVEVTDNHGAKDDAQFTITIKRETKLEITDLKVLINDGESNDRDEDISGSGDSFDVEIGETVTFEIDLKSLLDDNIDEEDIDINDILVEIEIEDFDGGDSDQTEESDEFDLKPGKKETVTIEFGEVDKDMDDGTYDVTVTVTGEDEDNQDHEVVWEFEMKVEKPTHKIIIDNIDYQENLNCAQSSFEIKVRLENVGQRDEDEVILILDSDSYGFDFTKRFINLEIDEEDDLTKSMTVNVPSDLNPGTYYVEVIVYNDNNDYEDEETADVETLLITIPTCGSTSGSNGDDDNGDDSGDDGSDDDNQDDGSGMDVVTGGAVDTGATTGSFLGDSEKENGFFEGPLGITALVLLNVLLVVLIVVLLMKAFRN